MLEEDDNSALCYRSVTTVTIAYMSICTDSIMSSWYSVSVSISSTVCLVFFNVILVLGVICYSKLTAYKISYKYMSLLDNTYLNFPTYFQIDEN